MDTHEMKHIYDLSNITYTTTPTAPHILINQPTNILTNSAIIPMNNNTIINLSYPNQDEKYYNHQINTKSLIKVVKYQIPNTIYVSS